MLFPTWLARNHLLSESEDDLGASLRFLDVLAFLFIAFSYSSNVKKMFYTFVYRVALTSTVIFLVWDFFLQSLVSWFE